ncbi:GlxA family transcriptional regulator [Nannocystaceae bacterium ST9]
MIVHLVFDGVAEGPLGVGLDVVGTAARLASAGRGVATPKRQAAQRVVSIDGQPVRTGTGRSFAVDGALTLRGLGRGDVLVVPGLGAASEPEVAALLARPDVERGIEAIARAAAKGVLVAASCSATFVLAASGVLEDRQATTTWWLSPTFAKQFPRVSLCADRMVVESGDVLTAGSAFAHADLMLAIVTRTLGPSLAHLVAKYLVLDERPSQARYMVMAHIRNSDPAILQLEKFINSNLERQLTIEDMARATATSPRTLARRVEAALGTTPRQFARRLKIAHALHLLETTREPVETIAASVGYADPAAFRRIFQREIGESPNSRRTR